jgi:phosphoglycolate phosphatase-like HAD superfamily hydrolase
MIGDTEGDIDAGKAAGCRTILVGDRGVRFGEAVRQLLGAAE